MALSEGLPAATPSGRAPFAPSQRRSSVTMDEHGSLLSPRAEAKLAPSQRSRLVGKRSEQREGRGDGADDVGADQQFETQEDPSAEVGAVAVVAGAPVAALRALAEEDQACEQDSGEDDEDAGHFEELGEVLDEGVELGHGVRNVRGCRGVPPGRSRAQVAGVNGRGPGPACAWRMPA